MLKNEKNKQNKNMEYKTTPDGKENPKYVDLLDEDRAISGQKFVCLSFISPEKEIKQRETYLFEQYVKEWDMKKSLEKYSQFLSFIAFKHKLDYTIIDTDFTEFCKEEKDNLFLTNVADDYKTFLDKNEDKLMETYNVTVNTKEDAVGIHGFPCILCRTTVNRTFIKENRTISKHFLKHVLKYLRITTDHVVDKSDKTI